MKRAGLPLALALLLLVAPGAGMVSQPTMPSMDKLVHAYCPRVIDGDTAYFEVVEDGVAVAHTVRFIGVDTPETRHPDKGPERWGSEAAEFTRSRLEGQWVYLEYDLEKTDHYDRRLCYVWLADGTLFNMLLMESGLARFMVIAPNVRYSAYLIAAQKAAQQAQAGLWSPLPETVLQVDLSAMSVEELFALQQRVAEELERRYAEEPGPTRSP